MRRRYDEYADPITYWCWECGKECALAENGDERGPFYETSCCASTDYADMPPWCSYCGNETVADWQRVNGERVCLACAWEPET